MLKITFIIGLPGSGKTTYIKNHFKNAIVFDDFHKDAKNNSPLFKMSANYLPTIKALIDGKECVIADVEFCRPENLEIATQELKEVATVFNLSIEMDFLFFENAPEKCKTNAIYRGRAHHPQELAKIDELAKIYCIPSNAKIIPIETRVQ